MTERLLKLFPLLAVCSLAGCVSMPTGPSMMALPGNGRSFDEFRYDDYVCRQFAYEQAGGTPTRASVASGVGSAAVGAGLGAAAGAALGGGRGAAIGAGTGMLAGGLAGANTARASGSVSQQRYDMGYTQCMYAKGHRVPVSGQVQYSPAPSYSSAPSAPSAPSMPPPPQAGRNKLCLLAYRRLPQVFHRRPRRVRLSAKRSSIPASNLSGICFNEVMKCLFALGALVYSCSAIPSQGADFGELRHKLVEEVAASASNDGFPLSPSVVAAMEKVERHRFVPAWLVSFAYLNHPLPIGHGQTISQPVVVALMTELLKVKAGDKVLEIGTGSGYQAAVLAEIVKAVYSIEVIEPLEKQAAERLQSLGYSNVTVRMGDGYYGWPEAAPFDAIIVTAAASQIPPPLLKQLKPGGRMVIPLGMQFMTQYLMLVEKQTDGSIMTRQIVPVAFVPLTGGH